MLDNKDELTSMILDHSSSKGYTIIAASVLGSYSKGLQTEDSDIDVYAICNGNEEREYHKFSLYEKQVRLAYIPKQEILDRIRNKIYTKDYDIFLLKDHLYMDDFLINEILIEFNTYFPTARDIYVSYLNRFLGEYQSFDDIPERKKKYFNHDVDKLNYILKNNIYPTSNILL